MDSNLVHIYHRGRLIKTYVRQAWGGRATDADDHPAELSAYTTRAPDRIKSKAAEPGPAVAEFADWLSDGPLPWAKVRQGHKLLRLGERAARPSAWTPPAAGWSASWCRRWSKRLCLSCLWRCPLAASPGPAPSCQWRREHEAARNNHSETKPRPPALPCHISPPRKVYWGRFLAAGQATPFCAVMIQSGPARVRNS